MHFARSRLWGLVACAQTLSAHWSRHQRRRERSFRGEENMYAVYVAWWWLEHSRPVPQNLDLQWQQLTPRTAACVSCDTTTNTSDTRARRGTHTHVVITYRHWNAIKTHQMAINFKSTAIYRRFLHHHYSDVSCLHLRFVWDWLDTESFFIIYSRNRLEITCELHLLVNN